MARDGELCDAVDGAAAAAVVGVVPAPDAADEAGDDVGADGAGVVVATDVAVPPVD